MTNNVELARSFIAAIESGKEAAPFLHEDVIQEELPNAMSPKGKRANRAQMLEASIKGAKLLSAQRFEVRTAIGEGDRVALEADWTGTLASTLGPYPAGHTFRARLAMFFEFRDGRIISLRNYDCYLPATGDDVSL